MKKLFALLFVGSAVCLQGCDVGGKSAPTTKYPLMTSQWTKIVDKSDGENVYINDGNETILGASQKYFWLKTDSKNDGYSVQHVLVDCQNNRMKTLSFIKYKNKDEIMFSVSRAENEVDWEYISPGTQGNVFRNAACSGYRHESVDMSKKIGQN